MIAMLDLTLHGQHGPVCIGAIAERQDISAAYLERLFRKLREQGLVCSTRGARGGYELGRCASTISVANVVCAVDEPLDATLCPSARNDLTQKLWADLTRHVQEFLEHRTLAEICANRSDCGQVSQKITVFSEH